MAGGPIAVLIIEDEPAIRRFLRVSLGESGYRVSEAGSGQEAMRRLRLDRPDIIILDLGLPDVDGLDIIRAVRQASPVPIVVLSSRADERGKVEALDLGADDYVTKPFGIDELTARLRTALRHRLHQQGEPASFVTGDLMVDRVRRLVQVKGAEVKLSPREYDILQLLVQHAGKVLTHQIHPARGMEGADRRPVPADLHKAAAAQGRTRSAAAALHPDRDRSRLSAPRP